MSEPKPLSECIDELRTELKKRQEQNTETKERKSA